MDLTLKISEGKIGLITDVDQHLFVEKFMRGGYVFNRDHSLKTDPTGQRTGEKLNAVFLDMNSLYPSAMSHFYLPRGNYQWLDNCSAPDFPSIHTFEENGLHGWLFEIDGEIPLELHDSVAKFVFSCIYRPVPRDSMSPYNLSLVENKGMHWTPSKQMLIADLEPKRNIVVHHIL
jgi:hypothetical protein